jgi:hypothetical protein
MWFWILLALGGAFVAGVAAASESERRRLIAAPEKPPMRLLTSVVSDVRVSTMALSDSKTVCQLSIPLEHEVFTPPLPNGKYFKLIFTGTCAVKSYSHWYGIDACYRTTSDHDNFTERHHGLHLDGEAVFDAPLEQERGEHRYVFRYVGTGGRLAVRLESPLGRLRNAKISDDMIHLTVTPFTMAETFMLALYDPEAKAREAQERRRQEEVAKKAVEWATWGHLESNFLSADYQQQFAAKHRDKILNTFTKQWLSEYQQLLSNELLYTTIQSEHPHVLEVLEARFEVIRIAQRLSVQPAPESPSPVEPKPKKTLDEVLAGIERHRRRDLNKKRVKADDHKAEILQDLELLQEFIADLDNYPLDEDERERLITEFKERLLGGEEESGNGFRQL